MYRASHDGSSPELRTTQEDRTMSDPVKLALVGCGWISEAHVKGYRDLVERGCEEFVVTACLDPRIESAETRADEIATFQGSRPEVFATLETLVDSGVAGAADLCIPHFVHHSVAIPLLEGGLHVMVEKPMGLTNKMTRMIIDAAECADRVLAYGENIRRYLTARACAWALNERKLIGDLRRVAIHSTGYGPFDYDNPAFKWRGVKLLTGGGMILDSGAHFADMIQVLLGDVDEIACSMATYDSRIITGAPIFGDVPADVEDTWHAVLKFKSGVEVTWTYSRSLHGEDLRIAKYYGSEGTMTDLGFPFHPFQGGGEAVLADGTRVTSEQIQIEYLLGLDAETRVALFPYGATDGFAIEVWDFVNAIATGRKPEMDGHAGLRAKTLSETCYESVVAGTPVTFDDVLEGKIDTYQAEIDAFWKV
jgi:predicted dehydrogenase